MITSGSNFTLLQNRARARVRARARKIQFFRLNLIAVFRHSYLDLSTLTQFISCSLLFILISSSLNCQTEKEQNPELRPTITFIPLTPIVEKLPSPFEPLSEEELNTSWGKELFLANAFAKQQDYYQAVTTFKRALLLEKRLEAPSSRYTEALYGLLLSYYLSNKYDQVVESYENSGIQLENQQSLSNQTLQVVLYDSYLRRGETKKAFKVFQDIAANSAKLADRVAFYTQVATVNTPQLEKSKNSKLRELISTYNKEKKSPTRAGVLNAIFPGAGYWYVDQKQTAVTSFCLNALFIAAAWQFFDHGQVAAGVITTGFEFGWYFGGIKGAKLAAVQYNSTKYSKLANDTLVQQKLFPIFMLEYGF